ncbi:hypothetical protein EPUL_004591 [Erysiphe pulchra]|uniref:EB1 C-terminal domain-containing protein n=1 Tax=Erysiphe pulchra TaxID=225359 RepID=A0A2S4PNP6_9PEZI|nr:hypothetical protein EPUL_004591 [Erysiphe pulchra]
MSKVKFNVNTEYAYLQNFKILQNCFTRHGIERPINVELLIKCKMQDNLEFLQWTKRFWDQNYPGGEYDAVSRRRASGAPLSVSSNTPKATSMASRRGTTPTAVGRPTKGNIGISALQQENAALKDTVQGLERERDFYFSKLRDIEILVQQADEDEAYADKDKEDETNGNKDKVDGLIQQIQTILYSTEDGFEIPSDAEGIDDHETF